MSNQVTTYIKQTFVVKFMKAILVFTVLSIIANAFFLGRHVANEKQLVANNQVIEAIVIENNKLKTERDMAVIRYEVTQAKLNGALIPESTVKEAVSVHVIQPTKETAITAYNVTRDNVMGASDFVKTNAIKAWSYVQQ